jgi:hypothetical protein
VAEIEDQADTEVLFVFGQGQPVFCWHLCR